MAERDPDTESDPESDSDVQATSDEDFFEDVRKVLQNAFNDPHVALRSAEHELDSAMQACEQTLVNLNKAIILAIIELPATKLQKAVHCEEYAKCLEEVLCKFTKLLEPRKGSRGAFLLDASVVAGSLVKLLKGDKLKLVTEEWRDASKHNGIIVVLKDAEIVSDDQATRIVKLVSDAMFPTYVAEMGGYQANVGKSICMLCGREHLETVSVQVWLYGRMRQVNPSSYTAELQLFFAVHNTISQEDMCSKFKSFYSSQKARGCILQSIQDLPQALTVEKKDIFLLNIQSLTQGWHVVSSDFKESEACDIFLFESDDITFVGGFVLRGKSGTLSGTLDIPVSSARDVLHISFKLAAVGDTSSVPSDDLEKLQSHVGMGSESHFQRWEQEVRSWSPRWLERVSRKIKDWKTVGEKLGLSQENLNAIEDSEWSTHALEMLRLWFYTQYCFDRAAEHELVHVLKELGEFGALREWMEVTERERVGGLLSADRQKIMAALQREKFEWESKFREDEPSTSTAFSKSLTSETQSSTTMSSESSPDPGTGEFSAVFDYRGGRLGTYWSDDYLEIPKDAIPKGERWRVSGFIHTSLDRYHPYVDYNKGERLIAPVVQYRVEGSKHFKKLVKAVIHHSIRCGCTSLEDKVSVLLQSGSNYGTENLKEEWLPHEKQRIEDGCAYFEVDLLHITVYTTHFSDIICRICDIAHKQDGRVTAMLYGRLNPDVTNSYRAVLKLYVTVHSALNETAVFFESFLKKEAAAGNVFLGSENFPLSLRYLDNDDRIELRTEHLTQGWNVLSSTDMNYKATHFIPCLTKPTDPQLVDVLTFYGQETKLNGILAVSISNTRLEKLSSLKISFSLAAAGDTPSVSIAGSSVSSEQWKLTDERLYCVAQKISEWYGVGLKLLKSANELDMLRNNMCREHSQQRIAFEMLRIWRDRNHARSTKDELKAILQQALADVNPVQIEAIEELNSGVNEVQVDAEVSGDAFVTQVSGIGDVEPVPLGIGIRQDS